MSDSANRKRTESIHIATRLLDFRARTGRAGGYPESPLHAAYSHRMREARMSSRVGNMGYIFFLGCATSVGV